MAEGRVGLNIAVERFVVAEDENLGARLERLRARSLWHWKRGRVLLRRASRKCGDVVARVRVARAEELIRAVSRELRGQFVALRDAILLLALISRYALGRPLHGSEVEQRVASRRRKSGIVLGIAISALAFALLLPEREREAPVPDLLVSVAEARLASTTPEPASLESPRPAEPALAPELRPWQPVRQPMALYHLESPELMGLSMAYRVSQRGASRQDTLIWQPRPDAGDAETRRTAALLVVERHESNAPTEKPLFADLASRAAEHRLVVERMARPQDIRTKFGPMEAAEVTLRQENAVLPCLAFRRIDMAGVTIVGWLCGTNPRPVDRVSATCFLDRLDLVGGGRDASLRKFFAEAERSRQNCASARQPGRKLTWMDHEAPMPALKLSARR